MSDLLVKHRYNGAVRYTSLFYATILDGVLRSAINDGPAKIFHTGESFYEMPGDHHSVSANASKTKPARLLAVFVVDTNETELTTNE